MWDRFISGFSGLSGGRVFPAIEDDLRSRRCAYSPVVPFHNSFFMGSGPNKESSKILWNFCAHMAGSGSTRGIIYIVA